MPGRGTRRVRGPGDTCAWCKHMGAGPNVCTWKSFGNQNQFVSGADVAAACFGHMVASVWDGSNVRRQNKDRLKQCLASSVSEVGNGADAPPQHAWAASLLDACELHELRARRSRAPTGGSSCSGSSEDDENHCSGMESGDGFFRGRVRPSPAAMDRFALHQSLHHAGAGAQAAVPGALLIVSRSLY